jgi:hypothetical protein
LKSFVRYRCAHCVVVLVVGIWPPHHRPRILPYNLDTERYSLDNLGREKFIENCKKLSLPTFISIEWAML